MNLTRRKLLAFLPPLSFGLHAFAQDAIQNGAPAGSPRWVFLGTDTGKGIYRSKWNAATGTLGAPELAAETDRPTFFALHPSLPVLYAANEMTGKQAAVSAFSFDAASGTLTAINRLETHGDNPCAITVDRTGHAAYAANYTGGSLTAYKLGSQGELAQTVGVLAYKQPTHGPVGDRQDAAHLHCTVLSPDNDFLLVCDLGDDLILAFPIAPEAGASIQAPQRFATRPGVGPRHVAFHPNGQWLYCMNELDCSVELYDWSVSSGTPSLVARRGSRVSTITPDDPLPNNAVSEPSKPSTGCELIVSRDGRFLTTCSRGADNLVIYRIDGQTGMLSELQRLSCGGKIPRLIAFDPSQRWLLAMNQGSSAVTVFGRSPSTGKLNPKFQSVHANTPMCAVWV